MYSTIFLVLGVTTYVLTLVFGFKGNRFHTFYLGLVSSFIVLLLVYLSSFLYYENTYLTKGIFIGLLLFGFVVLPLQLLFDPHIKKRYITIAKVSALVLCFSILIPLFTITLRDSGIIELSAFYKKFLIITIVYVLLLVSLSLFLKMILKYTITELAIIVLISTLVLTFFRYNERNIFQIREKEFSFEIYDVVDYNILTRDMAISGDDIHGYYDGIIYYHSSFATLTSFKKYDIDTQEHWITQPRIELEEDYMKAKVFFYQGETYVGSLDKLYYLDDTEFVVIEEFEDGFFHLGISYIQNDHFYIEVNDRRYQVDSGDILTYGDSYYTSIQTEHGFSRPLSINNWVYMSNDSELYFDGKVYDVAVKYPHRVSIYNGYLMYDTFYIKDGVLYETDYYIRDIVEVDGTPYLVDLGNIYNLETEELYRVNPIVSIEVVNGLENPIVLFYGDSYIDALAEIDFSPVTKISFDKINPYEVTYGIFVIFVLACYAVVRESTLAFSSIKHKKTDK